MQCKVLKFDPRDGAAKIESEVNRWLAQGWRIASTASGDYDQLFVFLTK